MRIRNYYNFYSTLFRCIYSFISGCRENTKDIFKVLSHTRIISLLSIMFSDLLANISSKEIIESDKKYPLLLFQ